MTSPTRNTIIRDANAHDFEAICALNLAEVRHTSTMDGNGLVALDKLSCYHKVGVVDGHVAAFLLAVCSGAAYENDNFLWFADRYPRFIYVDRIVVSSASQGLRLGSLLYRGLFDYAPRQRHPPCHLRVQHRPAE